MSQKPVPAPEPPAGPPPPGYTPSEANSSAPSGAPYMNPQNTGQTAYPNNGNNFNPGYPPPQGPYPPQGFQPAEGYYGPPPNAGYGQPPYGAYNSGAGPQGQYMDDRGRKGSPGFLEGLLAACACCCCLDILF
ncbi:hypothetical protein GcM1_228043 [Golovinomyces cichoracearum]|uniref:Cysteine-rich transmembrane CYSTM domain-containing protein n=1 Tax=Golovinomyces cichoracearum TaxID=62708 RepID=A0A420INZ9_9PEZI|nr:hypothetical protein GcM1_228043 [Golovinomyces cichoracearum]